MCRHFGAGGTSEVIIEHCTQLHKLCTQRLLSVIMKLIGLHKHVQNTAYDTDCQHVAENVTKHLDLLLQLGRCVVTQLVLCGDTNSI